MQEDHVPSFRMESITIENIPKHASGSSICPFKFSRSGDPLAIYHIKHQSDGNFMKCAPVEGITGKLPTCDIFGNRSSVPSSLT